MPSTELGPISEALERRLGARFMQQKASENAKELMECPPVSPQLIAHLRLMFTDPGKDAKPTNPILSQLLMIQYGCDKVLHYLQSHYDKQSLVARMENDR